MHPTEALALLHIGVAANRLRQRAELQREYRARSKRPDAPNHFSNEIGALFRRIKCGARREASEPITVPPCAGPVWYRRLRGK
jgi:hypothetical protein